MFAAISEFDVFLADCPARSKPIVDCNNPVEVEHFTMTTAPGTSPAMDIARATGGHVVKAVNFCHALV
jgi:predicted dinucleotide-binding enzyme